jgi:hypothetical protein
MSDGYPICPVCDRRHYPGANCPPPPRAFTVGQPVAVRLADGGVIQGELRAIDEALAVVLIDGRSERVPVENLI